MTSESGQEKLCFVIGPIGENGSGLRQQADWVLSGIIKPVFVENFPDFKVQRSDEIAAPGNINSQVITRLISAKLVVADMSFHNANAFYELAIRHAAQLPAIHMIRKDWNIPFDVAGLRAIQFSIQKYDDLEEARKALRDAVAEVQRPHFQVENPVTHVKGMIELQKHATPAERLLADELEAIRGRMERLEARVANAPLAAPPYSGPMLLPDFYRLDAGPSLALRVASGLTEPPAVPKDRELQK
jgi:hypothetical protein